MRIKLVSVSVLLLTIMSSGCPKPLNADFSSGRSSRPLAISLGTGSGGAASGEPVAVIGETVLTLEHLQKRIDGQSPFVKARYSDPEKRKEFLRNQVRFEVLAKEALRKGLQNEPDVQEAIKKIIVQRLTRKEFDGRVKPGDVTDEDMRKYFDSHPEDYNKPEMVRSSHIFVAFGADRKVSRARIDEAQKKAANPEKLKDRNHFKALVAEYSEDDGTKRAGGDLRYLSSDDLAEKFGAVVRDVLLSLEKINDVSGVLEGKAGWHVFKRTGNKKAITRSFDQVRNQIRNVLYREKRTSSFNAYVEKLSDEFGVQLFEEKLSGLQVGRPRAPAPGAGRPAGHGAIPGIPGNAGRNMGIPSGARAAPARGEKALSPQKGAKRP